MDRTLKDAINTWASGGGATTEEDKLNDLTQKITSVIDEIRKWHVERTGKYVRFIASSNDV